MKQIKSTLRTGVALVALLATQSTVNAQTRIMPSNSPNNWFSTTNPVQGLNTAQLVAFPATAGSSVWGSTSIISAAAYWDGSNAGFMVSDLLNGSISLTSITGATGTPDIAIGNTASGTIFSDYIIAVAYPTSSGLKVDLYDLLNDGTAAPTISSSPVGTYSYTFIPGFLGGAGTVHIDVETDYNNPTGPGLGLCRYGFVTWDNATNGNIYAAHIDLQATGTPALNPGFATTGKTPDVAGVYRGNAGPGDEIALLTYTDLTGSRLFYNEWDFTTPTAFSAITMDNVGVGNTVSIPRIDADDDYATSGSTANAVYDIVAQVNNSGQNEIRSYNNLLGAGTYYTSSNAVTFLPLPCISAASYNAYTPTVAIGGPAYFLDGTHYMISHFTDDGTPLGIVFMEPVDYSTGYLVNPPNEYYWVNEAPGALQSTSGNYAASVSTPTNYPSKAYINAWAYPGNSGTGIVEYKMVTGSWLGYSYKHSGSAIGNESVAKLSVYPNPAHDILTVPYPNCKSAEYNIISMIGACVQTGTVDQAQQIRVGDIASGTYILKLYNSGGEGTQAVFVKD